MTIEWKDAGSKIADLLSRDEDDTLREVAFSFVVAAEGLPVPDDVGLGYWRRSVRFTWAECEVELFVDSIETYRFRADGTDIATMQFRPGDALPASISELFRSNDHGSPRRQA